MQTFYNVEIKYPVDGRIITTNYQMKYLSEIDRIRKFVERIGGTVEYLGLDHIMEWIEILDEIEGNIEVANKNWLCNKELSADGAAQTGE